MNIRRVIIPPVLLRWPLWGWAAGARHLSCQREGDGGRGWAHNQQSCGGLVILRALLAGLGKAFIVGAGGSAGEWASGRRLGVRRSLLFVQQFVAERDRLAGLAELIISSQGLLKAFDWPGKQRTLLHSAGEARHSDESRMSSSWLARKGGGSRPSRVPLHTSPRRGVAAAGMDGVRRRWGKSVLQSRRHVIYGALRRSCSLPL